MKLVGKGWIVSKEKIMGIKFVISKFLDYNQCLFKKALEISL